MPIYLPGGTGGAGAISVADDQFFTSTGQRDAFFAANPSKLVANAYCVVNGVLQKYTNGVWVDNSVAIRGPNGDPGIDGFSPTIQENAANTTDTYKLDITDANGTFTTPNLKGVGGAGGGIVDAPEDGKLYGRRDASWAEIVGGGPGYDDTGIRKLISDEEAARITADATKADLDLSNVENAVFLAKSEAAGVTTGIEDAPEDGKQYARKDGEWSEITVTTATTDHADLIGRDSADQHPMASITGLGEALDAKQATEAGKGLSTNDFDATAKNKLDGIEAGAQVNLVEKVLLNGVELPVTNKAVDIILGSVFTYKGAVPDFADLPTDPAVGDVWKAVDSDVNYAWNGLYWDAWGGTIDLSAYITSAQLTAALAGYLALDGDASNSTSTFNTTGVTDADAYASGDKLSRFLSLTAYKDARVKEVLTDLILADNVIAHVATKAALDAYDTTKVKLNDMIVVSADETRAGAKAYYQWKGPVNARVWTFVFSESVKQEKLTEGANISIVGNVISSLHNGVSYTLSEQWTGKTWIDGKKIYQKTINCGALPNTASKNIPHNIANVNEFIFAYGFAYARDIGSSLPLPTVSNTPANCVSFFILGDNISLGTGVDRSIYTSSYITLQYTCTDR